MNVSEETWMWIAGAIDPGSSPVLVTDLESHARAGRLVMLDLTQATTLTRAACRQLDRTRRLARRHGGDVRVVRASPAASQALQEAGVSTWLRPGAR